MTLKTALFAFVTLGLSAAFLPACAPSSGEPDGATVEAASLVVTAKDTASLTGSARLELDLAPGLTITFDASAGAIDFSRVDLITSEGDRLSMTDFVKRAAQAEGVDPSAFATRTFRVSGDAADAPAPADAQVCNPCATPQKWGDCWFIIAYQTADGGWHYVEFPC